MSEISPSDQATLDSIEALLVAEKTSVRDALEAAYKLGHLTGMIHMAEVGEGMVRAVKPE
jgi:hypothetical protein